MAGHGTKFGHKKEEAIAALLTQRNLEEAARTAGIGTRTLLRWLQTTYQIIKQGFGSHLNVTYTDPGAQSPP
jgi:transposase-like protein